MNTASQHPAENTDTAATARHVPTAQQLHAAPRPRSPVSSHTAAARPAPGRAGNQGMVSGPQSSEVQERLSRMGAKPLFAFWRMETRGTRTESSECHCNGSNFGQVQNQQPQQCCLAELPAFSLPQHTRDLFSACLCKCAEHIKELKVRGAEKERRKPCLRVSIAHQLPVRARDPSWKLPVPS